MHSLKVLQKILSQLPDLFAQLGIDATEQERALLRNREADTDDRIEITAGEINWGGNYVLSFNRHTGVLESISQLTWGTGGEIRDWKVSFHEVNDPLNGGKYVIHERLG